MTRNQQLWVETAHKLRDMTRNQQLWVETAHKLIEANNTIEVLRDQVSLFVEILGQRIAEIQTDIDCGMAQDKEKEPFVSLLHDAEQAIAKAEGREP